MHNKDMDVDFQVPLEDYYYALNRYSRSGSDVALKAGRAALFIVIPLISQAGRSLPLIASLLGISLAAFPPALLTIVGVAGGIGLAAAIDRLFKSGVKFQAKKELESKNVEENIDSCIAYLPSLPDSEQKAEVKKVVHALGKCKVLTKLEVENLKFLCDTKPAIYQDILLELKDHIISENDLEPFLKSHMSLSDRIKEAKELLSKQRSGEQKKTAIEILDLGFDSGVLTQEDVNIITYALRAYPNRRFCFFIVLKIMTANAKSIIAT